MTRDERKKAHIDKIVNETIPNAQKRMKFEPGEFTSNGNSKIGEIVDEDQSTIDRNTDLIERNKLIADDLRAQLPPDGDK